MGKSYDDRPLNGANACLVSGIVWVSVVPVFVLNLNHDDGSTSHSRLCVELLVPEQRFWYFQAKLSKCQNLSRKADILQNILKMCQIYHSLQMKDRWESNIKVWFPFMYSHKNKTMQPRSFQNRIIMFWLLIPTLIYLWEIYTYISRISLSILLQPNMWSDPGNT
jgi:hypothetical protein